MWPISWFLKRQPEGEAAALGRQLHLPKKARVPVPAWPAGDAHAPRTPGTGVRAAGSGAAHAGSWEPFPGGEGRGRPGGAGPPAVRPLISAAAEGARAPSLTKWSCGEEDSGGWRVSKGRRGDAGSGLRRWKGSRLRRKEEGQGWGGGLRVWGGRRVGTEWEAVPARETRGGSGLGAGGWSWVGGVRRGGRAGRDCGASRCWARSGSGRRWGR